MFVRLDLYSFFSVFIKNAKIFLALRQQVTEVFNWTNVASTQCIQWRENFILILKQL